MPKRSWKKKNETKGVDLVESLSLNPTPCMDGMNNIPCVQVGPDPNPSNLDPLNEGGGCRGKFEA